MIFPADGRVRNFLGGGELACFHCIDSCFVSGFQWWIHVSSPVTIWDKAWSGLAAWRANISEHVSTRNDLLTGISKSGTHLAQTLLKPRCSLKIFRTLPHDMPISVAISWTFSRRSSITSVSTAWQQSSVVASTGHPALWSSPNDVLPCWNSETHLVTAAYDGALSP